MNIAWLLHAILKYLIKLINMKIPILNCSLCRVSCVAQQLNLRLEQACFWPGQYLDWYLKEKKLTPLAQAQVFIILSSLTRIVYWIFQHFLVDCK